jgi:hypothetical protein
MRVLRHGRAEHRVVRAVGLRALVDVVVPADAVAMEEPGEIRPRVVRDIAGFVLRFAGRRAGVLDGTVAAHRVALPRASSRPAGDEVEVLGQAPRRVRLEHVVLEDEVARVTPVVRDLAPVVVAHDVRVLRRVRAARVVEVLLAVRRPAELRLGDVAVHPPPGHVGERRAVPVRPARVAVPRVVIGPLAVVSRRIGDTRQAPGVTGEPGDPVGARVGAEIGVERAVLLHDDHDVADLVDPCQR